MIDELRTLADGASSAWQDAPEFLKPILRDCSDALVGAADEIERLRADNADLLFTLRVQIGAAIARTDEERAAVSRAFTEARKR